MTSKQANLVNDRKGEKVFRLMKHETSDKCTTYRVVNESCWRTTVGHAATGAAEGSLF